jgi:hypothetical protein
MLAVRCAEEWPHEPACLQVCERHVLRLAVLVAAAEVVDEHLFDGLVVGHEDVADGVSADEVADFFGEILGVVAGALERLRHKDDLQAGLAGDVLGILDVAQEDEVAEAVHFGIGAEDVDGFTDLAVGEGVAAVGQHFFEDGRHLREVAGVFGVDASAGGLGAVGEAEKEVAYALKTDHELHTGKKFACFGRADLRDGGGDTAVDFHVERIELAFALAERVEQRGGAGGDAFSGGSRGLLGHAAGFHSAAHDVVMSRFWSGDGNGCTHDGFRRARTRAAMGFCRTVTVVRPLMGWTRHGVRIRIAVDIVVKKL